MGDTGELDGYEPDKLGELSERKIAIVSKYAAAHANILTGQAAKALLHRWLRRRPDRPAQGTRRAN